MTTVRAELDEGVTTCLQAASKSSPEAVSVPISVHGKNKHNSYFHIRNRRDGDVLRRTAAV
jgi:hypothetical protein